MYKSSVFPVDPNKSLTDIQAIIEQTEAQRGSLLAISPFDHTATWLTVAHGPPQNKSIKMELLPVNSAPTAVAGYEFVCIGDCYIKGVATGVAVYRQI